MIYTWCTFGCLGVGCLFSKQTFCFFLCSLKIMPLRILKILFPNWNDQYFFPAFDQNNIFHKSDSKIPRYYLGNPLMQSQLFKTGFELIDCHSLCWGFFPAHQFIDYLLTVSVTCISCGHYQLPVTQNRKAGITILTIPPPSPPPERKMM